MLLAELENEKYLIASVSAKYVNVFFLITIFYFDWKYIVFGKFIFLRFLTKCYGKKGRESKG